MLVLLLLLYVPNNIVCLSILYCFRNKQYFNLQIKSFIFQHYKFIFVLGLPYKRRMTQHFLPKNLNKKFLETEKFNNEITNYKDVKDFLTRLNEKKKNMELFRAKYVSTICILISQLFCHSIYLLLVVSSSLSKTYYS